GRRLRDGVSLEEKLRVLEVVAARPARRRRLLAGFRLGLWLRSRLGLRAAGLGARANIGPGVRARGRAGRGGDGKAAVGAGAGHRGTSLGNAGVGEVEACLAVLALDDHDVPAAALLVAFFVGERPPLESAT